VPTLSGGTGWGRPNPRQQAPAQLLGVGFGLGETRPGAGGCWRCRSGWRVKTVAPRATLRGGLLGKPSGLLHKPRRAAPGVLKPTRSTTHPTPAPKPHRMRRNRHTSGRSGCVGFDTSNDTPAPAQTAPPRGLPRCAETVAIWPPWNVSKPTHSTTRFHQRKRPPKQPRKASRKQHISGPSGMCRNRHIQRHIFTPENRLSLGCRNRALWVCRNRHIQRHTMRRIETA